MWLIQRAKHAQACHLTVRDRTEHIGYRMVERLCLIYKGSSNIYITGRHYLLFICSICAVLHETFYSGRLRLLDRVSFEKHVLVQVECEIHWVCSSSTSFLFPLPLLLLLPSWCLNLNLSPNQSILVSALPGFLCIIAFFNRVHWPGLLPRVIFSLWPSGTSKTWFPCIIHQERVYITSFRVETLISVLHIRVTVPL